MSLTIDSDKIADVVEQDDKRPTYVVRPVYLPEVPEPKLDPPTNEVHSTVQTPLAEVLEAHKRLLALRETLKKRNVPTLSAEELDRAIEHGRE